MGDGETLVGEGSFLIDRKRALEKLMRFQLPDSRMYPLPWVQAALASGAANIHVWPTRAGFEMAFDGLPWDPQALKDPYRHLFEEDADGSKARYRELAIGLLSALRVQPEHVSLTFSQGKEEYVLHVDGLAKETLEKLPTETLSQENPKFGSGVRMSIFVGKALDPFDKELRFLNEHCRHCPVPISVKGTLINAPLAADLALGGADKPASLSRKFSVEGVTGSLALAAEDLPASSLDLVTRGVSVATERPQLPGAQVVGFVRNDGFRKSLSQMGVVKDEVFQRTMEIVSAESVALLKDAAQRAWTLWGEVGSARSSLHALWMPWVHPSLGEMFEGMLLTPAQSPGAREAGRTALSLSICVAALRQACLLNRVSMLKGDRGVGEVLWEAPVVCDAKGEPLTLLSLEKQRRWLGYVPFVTSYRPGYSEQTSAAWAVRHLDKDFLEAFFPDQVRRLASRADKGAPSVLPVLEEPNLLAKKPFEADQICGEVGLSLSPHPRSSRIRWLNNGFPLGQNVWRLGSLRLEAVVNHPSIGALPADGSADPAARECLSAVLRAAPQVYQLIAQEYKPAEETPRQGIIREHLLDLMTASWDPARQDCPSQPWLAPLPLFRSEDNRMLSLQDLRAEASQGRRERILACPHPERLKPAFVGYPRHAKVLFQSSPLVASVFDPDDKPAPPPPAIPPLPGPAAAPGARLSKISLEPSSPSVSPNAVPPQRPPQPVSPPPAPPPEPKPAPPPAPPPAAAPPAPPVVDDLVAGPELELRRWLKALKRMDACPLSEGQIDRVRFNPQAEGAFLCRAEAETWELNSQHPLFQEIESHGELLRHMPYLASVFLSGLNRALPEVTDAQDERCTMALVDLLLALVSRRASPPPGGPKGRNA